MFSKACEYAIKATIYIAEQSKQEKRVSLKDIARQIDSPEAFTAKILQQLVKSLIVTSLKGPSGGFEIPQNKIRRTTLYHIVSAIDGADIYHGCGLGLKQCNERRPCPIHDKFKKIREGLQHMLEHTTLEELTVGLKTGNTFLIA